MRYFSILALALLTGCATIVTGSSTDVSINSDPPNAEIEINGQDYGETPTTISLESDQSHMVELSLEGYEDETIQLRKSTSGWLAGNILLGGIPGLIIDAATGGMYVLSPEEVGTDLEKTSSASTSKLRIQVAMDLRKEDLRKIGQLEAKN